MPHIETKNFEKGAVRIANLTQPSVSDNLVPLTVIKGAGHEFIPLPQGENATTADFHSIRTKTESPAHFTSGFYKIEAGPARPAHYSFEETKYVLNGQIDVLVCSSEAASNCKGYSENANNVDNCLFIL
jgi:hypothetical protein